MMLRGLVALNLILACLLVVDTGRASESLSVVILAERSGEPTVSHLTEQLRGIGFEVVIRPTNVVEAYADVASAAKELGPVAVFRLREADGGIELWIVNEGGAPLLSEVLVPSELSGEYRYTAPVRAVENLRATLVKLGVLPPSGRVEPTAAAPTPTQPREPEAPQSAVSAPSPAEDDDGGLWFGLGGAALRSNGGVGATGHVLVAAQWMFGRSVGIRGHGLLPVLSAKVEGPEGSASVAPTVLGAGLVLRRGASDRAVTPELEVGIAAAMVDTDGHPIEGYQGQRDDTAAAFPYVGVGVGVPLADAWRLRGGAQVATAAPRTDVRFGTRKAASWGGLVLAGAMSVEARVF